MHLGSIVRQGSYNGPRFMNLLVSQFHDLLTDLVEERLLRNSVEILDFKETMQYVFSCMATQRDLLNDSFLYESALGYLQYIGFSKWDVVQENNLFTTVVASYSQIFNQTSMALSAYISKAFDYYYLPDFELRGWLTDDIMVVENRRVYLSQQFPDVSF